MDKKTVQYLAKLMDDHGLTELDIESEELKVRMTKGGQPQVVQAVAAAPIAAAPAPVAAAPAAAPAAEAAAAPAASEDFSGCKEITAPIPGTVYLKPNPESDNYVSVGGAVAEGDVVCLIEAMKVFNEIKAECVSGTIKKVCFEDGQAVEYGTVLFLVG